MFWGFTEFKDFIAMLPKLFEAKQVGTLYHHTSYSNAIKIVLDNKILASWGEGGSGFVSLTRNRHFLGDVKSGLGGVGAIILLDGDKLSNHYKIQPWHYGVGVPKDVADFGDEQEERILKVAKIDNIKSYIIGVRLYEIFFPTPGKRCDEKEIMKIQRWLGMLLEQDPTLSDVALFFTTRGMNTKIIPTGRVWA